MEISYVFKQNITKKYSNARIKHYLCLEKVLFWQKFDGILRKRCNYKILRVVKRKKVFVQNNDKII